jgi:hypothetical protein
MSITEELLGRKISGFGLEIWEYGCGDPSRWPRGTLCPQALALTLPRSGAHSVAIVCTRTKATELVSTLLPCLSIFPLFSPISNFSCWHFPCSSSVCHLLSFRYLAPLIGYWDEGKMFLRNFCWLSVDYPRHALDSSLCKDRASRRREGTGDE